MEDILSIVVVVLFYAAVVGSVRRRSGRRRAERQRAARKPQFDKAFEAVDGVFAVGKAGAQAAPARTDEREERKERDCQTSRLHLHEVTQSELLEAAEGEDPCHAGHAPGSTKAERTEIAAPEREALGEAASEEEAPDERAQDILRGVIMSEILTRPCERRRKWSTYGR